MFKRKKDHLLGPVITIIAIIFCIMIVSFIGSLFGIQSEVTKINNGSLETSMVSINNIFSEDGLKYFFSSPIESFKMFEPLVLLIISLMAISIGKASGLLKAIFTPLRKLKPAVLTFITLLLGIASTALGNYGYIILIPLTAVAYQYIGRNSVLGILTSFLGITLGYAAGFLFSYDDYSLGLLTKAAVNVDINSDYIFNSWSNIYIMIASAIILTIFGTIIVETVLKPRVKPSIKDEQEYHYSKKGLIISSLSFVILLCVFTYMIIPGLPASGALLGNGADYVVQLLGDNSPFTNAFVFIFLIIMMICSGIYGFISGNLKDTNDYSVGLSREFDHLGYMFILMFFAALMVSILEWTNIGEVIAGLLISFMSNLEFTGLPLIIIFMIIVIIISIFIPDNISKWVLISPVVIPMFMKANISPDFTQFIFKAADSIGKCITPLFVYYIVTLAFVEKYNDKESLKITVFGTLKKMWPAIVLFIVVWFVIIIGWFVIGLPTGPGFAPTL